MALGAEHRPPLTASMERGPHLQNHEELESANTHDLGRSCFPKLSQADILISASDTWGRAPASLTMLDLPCWTSDLQNYELINGF